MGWGERIHHASGKFNRRAAETAGEATGKDRLGAEGKARRVRVDLKNAGEKIKGAFRKH